MVIKIDDNKFNSWLIIAALVVMLGSWGHHSSYSYKKNFFFLSSDHVVQL